MVSIFISEKIVTRAKDSGIGFMVGSGIGSYAASLVFIFGGIMLHARLPGYMHELQWVIGIMFLATALYQLYLILKKEKTNPL